MKWLKGVTDFISNTSKSTTSERPLFDVYLPSILGGVRIIDELQNNEVRITDVRAQFKAPFIMFRYEPRYSAFVPNPIAYVFFW